MVGRPRNQRRGARPGRNIDANKGIRNTYGNIKKKIVARAVNQARRNGARPRLRKIADEGNEPRAAARFNRRPEGGPATRVRRSSPQQPIKRSHSADENISIRPRSRENKRPTLKTVVVQRSPVRVEKRREVASLASRVERRSPPHGFTTERRRNISPGHQSFPNRGRDEVQRMRNEDQRRSFSPRMRREVARPFRDAPISTPNKIPVFHDKFKQNLSPRRFDMIDARRGPMAHRYNMLQKREKPNDPESRPRGADSSPPNERGPMQRRDRSPGRGKQIPRTERERYRDGPGRKIEKHYGNLESELARLPPRKHPHRNVRYRGSQYPGCGMESPPQSPLLPIGFGYTRVRSITPPSMRFMHLPPRPIHAMESNYRPMRSGRRDVDPPWRPMQPLPYELSPQRERPYPYGLRPHMRGRMLPSRRSMEREEERYGREFRPPPPLARFGGPMPTRCRSPERHSRYMPGSNYHFDSLMSRR